MTCFLFTRLFALWFLLPPACILLDGLHFIFPPTHKLGIYSLFILFRWLHWHFLHVHLTSSTQLIDNSFLLLNNTKPCSAFPLISSADLGVWNLSRQKVLLSHKSWNRLTFCYLLPLIIFQKNFKLTQEEIENLSRSITFKGIDSAVYNLP